MKRRTFAERIKETNQRTTKANTLHQGERHNDRTLGYKPNHDRLKVKNTLFIALLILIIVLLRSTKPNKMLGTTAPLEEHHENFEKTLCGETHMAEPFQRFGYQYIGGRYDCSQATIIWIHSTKQVKWENVKPWQRINHICGEHDLGQKDIFFEGISDYSYRTRESIHFIPETYLLRNTESREMFLERLENGGGMDEPWVSKDPSKHGGAGIEILGPGSEQLKKLSQSLTEKSPLRKNEGHYKYSDRTRLLHDRANHNKIVQKYIGDLLLYKGHKFDLRVYWLIASAEPLAVFYHDGTLRLSTENYTQNDFSARLPHLTNLQQQTSNMRDLKDRKNWKNWRRIPEESTDLDDARASFDDFDIFLREYVSKNDHLAHITDPLAHIRDQMKAAIATVVDAFRNSLLSTNGCAQPNAFSLMGADFLVDKNLNIWMTEVQSAPGQNRKTSKARENFDIVIPSMVEIVLEVIHKEKNGENVLPIERSQTWELIYTDNFRFTNDKNQ